MKKNETVLTGTMTYEDCLICLDGLNEANPLPFNEIKGLENSADYMPSGKFMYAVGKNKRELQKVIDVLSDLTKPSDGYKEYERKREEILQKYATKDEKGEPVMRPDGKMVRYEIKGKTDPESDFRKEMDEFLKKNKTFIEEQENNIKRYNSMLKEKSEFVPFLVDEVEIPLGLSAKAWEGLHFIIRS